MGVYASARFSSIPSDDVFGSLFRGDATLCHHDDILGGVYLECVSGTVPGGVVKYALDLLGGTDVRVVDIKSVEWFGESMLVAGGRCVSWDWDLKRTVVTYGRTEVHSESWWALRGWLAFHVDSVDIAHPHAVHAVSSAQAFESKISKLWKLV